jgi:Hemerythrin HHE cation binding domain
VADEGLAMIMRRAVEGARRALALVARAVARRSDGTSSAPEPTTQAGAERIEERDALDILTEEHREIEAWLDSLEHDPASAEVPDLIHRVVVHLHAHVDAEEHTFYRHLREEIGNLGGLLDTSDGRHTVIGQLLVLLKGTDPSDAAAVGRVVAPLKHEFDDDVHLEEETIFPRVRVALPRERLVALGRMLAQERGLLLASE